MFLIFGLYFIATVFIILYHVASCLCAFKKTELKFFLKLQWHVSENQIFVFYLSKELLYACKETKLQRGSLCFYKLLDNVRLRAVRKCPVDCPILSISAALESSHFAHILGLFVFLPDQRRRPGVTGPLSPL
jgi:hypothetical protein